MIKSSPSKKSVSGYGKLPCLQNGRAPTKHRGILMLLVVLVFGYSVRAVLAQESQGGIYVPLVGISSVPEPLSLPGGPGRVTYHYAIKNFLSEYPFDTIEVIDNKCNPVKFIEGDDNHDSKLDFSETWRYACDAKLLETTQSIATVMGTANGLPAAHKAYVTVVVGSEGPAPLVNIINITKVAYPLALPVEGGDITFTYRVNNPGVVPLSNVVVSDDKCSAMSSRLGDINGNNLLDISEVWVYTCAAHLTETTSNTASVTAYANGLKAVGYATITVTVAQSNISDQGIPSLPDTGALVVNFKVMIWAIMAVVLIMLVIFFIPTRKNRGGKKL